MVKSITVTVLALLAGCAAVKESEEESSGPSRLREYESSFRPSEYNQPIKDFFPDTSVATGDSGISPIVTSQGPEWTQGYRVQVFATTSFDEATKAKAALEVQFVDEWFYLVYDAPTYKLRAGNFLERYEADRFARQVSGKGYRDAWVVPERVFKNPSPRSPLPRGTQK